VRFSPALPLVSQLSQSAEHGLGIRFGWQLGHGLAQAR